MAISPDVRQRVEQDPVLGPVVNMLANEDLEQADRLQGLLSVSKALLKRVDDPVQVAFLHLLLAELSSERPSVRTVNNYIRSLVNAVMNHKEAPSSDESSAPDGQERVEDQNETDTDQEDVAPEQQAESADDQQHTEQANTSPELQQARSELLQMLTLLDAEEHLRGFCEQLDDVPALGRLLETLKKHFWSHGRVLSQATIDVLKRDLSFPEKVAQINSEIDLQSLFVAFVEVRKQGIMSRFDYDHINYKEPSILQNAKEYRLYRLEQLQSLIDQCFHDGVRLKMIRRTPHIPNDEIKIMEWGENNLSWDFFSDLDHACELYIAANRDLSRKEYDILAANLNSIITAFSSDCFDYKALDDDRRNDDIAEFKADKSLVYYLQKEDRVEVYRENAQERCLLFTS